MALDFIFEVDILWSYCWCRVSVWFGWFIKAVIFLILIFLIVLDTDSWLVSFYIVLFLMNHGAPCISISILLCVVSGIFRFVFAVWLHVVVAFLYRGRIQNWFLLFRLRELLREKKGYKIANLCSSFVIILYFNLIPGQF